MLQEFVKSVKDTAQKNTENMHTAVPAVIVEYDASTGLATVLPKAQFKKPNGEKIDYPPISGVPVAFPQSKNVTIAFPVKEGDNCILVFGEQALDYWLYGKETDTDLKFDLSNAMAIPNIATAGNPAMQEACNEDAVVIRSGSVTLKVKSDAVHIIGDLKVEGTITSTSGTMNVTQGKATINGTLEVNGSVVTAGDVTANGKSLQHHTHTGDSGGTTSEPR